MGESAKTYINIGGQDIDADTVTIPTDRAYREAWVNAGAKIVVDMVRARDIHRDNLRAARIPLFEANDIALRDAVVEGDEAKRVAGIARRDALRSITTDPRIDAADTPEALAALTIDALLQA